MASLIKKIESTVNRLPEGLQRAQATIQGKRHFDIGTAHPLLPPGGSILDSPPGLDDSRRGLRDSPLQPAIRSSHDLISMIVAVDSTPGIYPLWTSLISSSVFAVALAHTFVFCYRLCES
jgi:hypothetical protein